MTKKREQGSWAHPALLEVARGLEHCSYVRPFDSLGPCSTRKYMTPDQWCVRCRAHAGLDELNGLVKVLLAHSGCRCADCTRAKRLVKRGEAWNRKYGLGKAETGAEKA